MVLRGNLTLIELQKEQCIEDFCTNKIPSYSLSPTTHSNLTLLHF